MRLGFSATSASPAQRLRTKLACQVTESWNDEDLLGPTKLDMLLLQLDDAFDYTPEDEQRAIRQRLAPEHGRESHARHTVCLAHLERGPAGTPGGEPARRAQSTPRLSATAAHIPCPG